MKRNYKLYDANGNELDIDDLQNKEKWCRKGVKWEDAFVGKYGHQFSIDINPEKRNGDKYAADLIQIAELKVRVTPLFWASKWGYDPQWTVTINVKDIERYKRRYPGIWLYWPVNWLAVRYEAQTTRIVEPMRGIWLSRLSDMDIESAPRLIYQNRTEDKRGNARDSYLFDLRKFQKIK